MFPVSNLGGGKVVSKRVTIFVNFFEMLYLTELSGGLPVLITRRHRPMFLLHKGGHFFFSVILQNGFIAILETSYCMNAKQ